LINPKSLSDIQSLISKRELSVLELSNHYLKKIETSKTNSFIEVYHEEILEKAAIIDAKIKNNSAGALAGMIIGVKDNICYKNHLVTGASKILSNFTSKFSATAVENLLKEDALIIGRLNCDEFAMGSSNENSVYGPVRNPLNHQKVPGGSSGGSAAAVAEGLCLAALGSDTGGSIRQPASFCGVVGTKPTYGRISRHGLLAYASSFDQIGSFTNSVEDATILTHFMSGKDKFDSTLSNKKPNAKDITPLTEKLSIGVPEEYLNFENSDAEIKAEIKSVVQKLSDQGHHINYVRFPFLKHIVPCYYVLTTAEACSNLARYDGAHFGYRSENSNDIDTTYENSRTEGFGIEVKRRIMLGNFVLSSGYYEAYFTKAQKVRRILQDKTNEILEKNDVLLFPTTPSTAFNIGQIKDPIKMYLQDIFTVHANLTGMPAISLPLGKHSNNMPFGVQLMTKNFKEDLLFSVSKHLL
jgi:aspartyl-tRNA(Asn)/glutamyl-tRNA(Gln) amidotransferase subunit A